MAHEIAPAEARSPQSVTPRTADELARLTAQRLLAEARWQAEQQRAAHFAATRHLLRWKIPASATERNVTGQPVIETTLAATERALRWESDQAKFIGRWQVHWDDARRATAQVRVAELTVQREEIVRRIATREAEYAERIEGHGASFAALSALHAQGVAGFKRAGRPLPSARFTAAELQTLDQLAARRGDANFYHTLTQLEREYDAQQSSAEPQSLSERTSRALGRSVIAEIAQREALERLQNFHFKRGHTDVWVRTNDDDQSFTARLSEVQPRSRLARAFPSFTTQSAPYQNVVAALTEHEQRLKEKLTRATEVRAVMEAVAQTYTAEFRRSAPAQILPAPRFTPAEQERISEWLARETDPIFQARYAALLRTAEPHQQDGQTQRESGEIVAARAGTPTATTFVYDSLAASLPEFASPVAATVAFAEREDRFDR